MESALSAQNAILYRNVSRDYCFTRLQTVRLRFVGQFSLIKVTMMMMIIDDSPGGSTELGAESGVDDCLAGGEDDEVNREHYRA